MKKHLKQITVGLGSIVTSLLMISIAHGDTIWQGWPSADETDGRFISIVGPFYSAPYNDIIMSIGIPVSAATFDLEFFDGDASFVPGQQPDSMYDEHRIQQGTDYAYELYEDQSRTGTTTNLLETRVDENFVNDDWSSFVTDHPASHGIAINPDDKYYWYRLELKYNGDTINNRFLNGLKVRVRSDGKVLSSISALGKVVVIASPINSNDPDLTDPDYSYDGNWAFPVRVPSGGISAPLLFTDSDADHANDLTTPSGTNTISIGAPLDDNPVPNLEKTISPSIQYEITDPSGSQLIFNTDPSGNYPDSETFAHNPPSGVVSEGNYLWLWTGVDAGNTIVLETNGEILPPCICH